jgi:hypothetical protein
MYWSNEPKCGPLSANQRSANQMVFTENNDIHEKQRRAHTARRKRIKPRRLEAPRELPASTGHIPTDGQRQT